MKRKERLILAMGHIDEKYVKEADVRMHGGIIIKVAAALLVMVLAVGLFLFVPYAPVTSNLKKYESSSYYPLIAEIDEYDLTFKQPKYKNNFDWILSSIDDMFTWFAPNGGMMGGDMNEAPGDAGEGSMMGNGSYVENTDNQVSGVIESDLMKMTDKYIFRLGYRIGEIEVEGQKPYDSHIQVLRVYSIDKEESTLVSEYDIPMFDDEFWKVNVDMEMYLSEDGNTVTILHDYTDNETNLGKVGVISLDVSDVNNIKMKGRVSIDGSRNTSRMVDGKLLIVSEFVFNRTKVDYSDPTTFVPTIDAGEGAEPIEFEDIVYPDGVNSTRYSVVTLLDADDLSLLGSVGALNFIDEVYVSRDNVYITREYIAKNEGVYEDKKVVRNMTDIAVINYSGESLEKRGVITVNGYAEDQYSFDEKDGYLRLVTSTRWTEDKYSNVASIKNERNVSLWIFDLEDNSLAYSLRNFAIPGEEATAVRFDGDMVYVCTAVVVTFTDPVYFIDLSDYENIDSADTGIIDGYSDHLINFGDGFVLGIGRENWGTSKVEIYEQQGNDVVSVDEFKFDGNYSLDYKAYLVNRENKLFGFAADYIYQYNEYNGREDFFDDCYVLLQFNGYQLSYIIIDLGNVSLQPDTVRAAYIDGYLYITTPTPGGFVVEKIN